MELIEPVERLCAFLKETEGYVVLRNPNIVSNLARGADVDLLVRDLPSFSSLLLNELGQRLWAWSVLTCKDFSGLGVTWTCYLPWNGTGQFICPPKRFSAQPSVIQSVFWKLAFRTKRYQRRATVDGPAASWGTPTWPCGGFWARRHRFLRAPWRA